MISDLSTVPTFLMVDGSVVSYATSDLGTGSDFAPKWWT